MTPANDDGNGRPLDGRDAEDAALRHLSRHGLRLVTRNYRCRRGEIDLIMRDGASLVFVEVRYRRSDRFGGALESVDARKRTRLIQTALHYLQSSAEDSPSRFDVVALTGAIDRPALQWIKDAFRP